MSIFSFSKTDKVWGLKRSLTMHMIDWWIGQVGSKPYLLKLKASYDDGYNHADLTEVAVEDKAELRDLVQLMLEVGYEQQLALHDTEMLKIRESLLELESLINGDLEGTALYQIGD